MSGLAADGVDYIPGAMIHSKLGWLPGFYVVFPKAVLARADLE